jgi:hypothetical protein
MVTKGGSISTVFMHFLSDNIDAETPSLPLANMDNKVNKLVDIQ